MCAHAGPDGENGVLFLGGTQLPWQLNRLCTSISFYIESGSSLARSSAASLASRQHLVVFGVVCSVGSAVLALDADRPVDIEVPDARVAGGQDGESDDNTYTWQVR